MKAALLISLILVFSCDQEIPQPPRDEIREVVELSTMEMRLREIIHYSSQDRIFFVPIGGEELLFSVDFAVRAGIRNGAQWSALPMGEDGIQVSLPNTQILSVDAIEGSINDLLDYREEIGINRFQELLEQRKVTLRQTALEEGILEKAESQLRRTLTAWLRQLGYQNIDIRFQEDALGS